MVTVKQNAVTGTAPSYAELVEANRKLQAALESASKSKQGTLTLKVSSMGGISIYGLYAQFPLSLYQGDVSRLSDAGILQAGPALQAFIDAHKAELSTGKLDPRFAEKRAARKLEAAQARARKLEADVV